MWTSISIVVEGQTDAAVLRRVVSEAGLKVATEHITIGKDKLDSHLKGYNSAAKLSRWIVLRDLNSDAECAPTLIARLLPAPARGMRLQIAVREMETWLLADTDAIGHFLSVPATHVPVDPDELPKPKQTLIDLARQSRSRGIREAIVPAQGMTARVGAGYSTMIAQFAADLWRPRAAAKQSPSLARLLRHLDTVNSGDRT